MRELLYTKYNSMRKPEYQIRTSIYLDGDKRYVEKSAVCEQARQQLLKLEDNYKILRETYKKIRIIPCENKNDCIRFPFLKGKSLQQLVSFADGDLEQIVNEVKQIIEQLYEVKEQYIIEFKMTRQFQEFFKGCVPEADQSFVYTNLDATFSNFMLIDGEIWCIDYEWLLDFPVPIKYVKFRTLLYLYNENYDYLKDLISQHHFFECFGYDDTQIDVFLKMEECFQQRVHGKDRRNIYLHRYEKEYHSYLYFEREIEVLEAERNDLERKYEETQNEVDRLKREEDRLNNMVVEQQMYINKITKAIKNPFYAIKCLIDKR